MAVATQRVETLDDLMGTEGKAELVNGKVVRFMASGIIPTRVAKRIFRRLDDFAEATGVGEAFPDGLGYAMKPPLPSGRESFQPDTSYYVGPAQQNEMKFRYGAPTFAAEVRSDGDYGPAADRAYSDKRRDYFFAGTLIVWDVDPLARTVTVYRADDPLTGVKLGPGDTADAEPAVPGWRVAVADLFV